MKKIISLAICVILAVSVLTGCNIVQQNYTRDYGQVIVRIEPITTTRTERRVLRDENGLPVKDVNGEIVTEAADKQAVRDTNGAPVRGSDGEVLMESAEKHIYTSQEITIYKSQLVNYVNYYLSSELNNSTETDKKKAVSKAVEKLLEVLITTELLTAEADRLFDAGVLYWTEAEVDEIQRSVYSSINDSILSYKNQLLTAKGLPELASITADTAEQSTTYPIMPDPNAPDEDEEISPEYMLPSEVKEGGEYQWFDSWYTDSTWYIEDMSKYGNSYPGLYGKNEERSLEVAAFTLYLDYMLENSKNIIGITKEQEDIIKEEVEMINKVRYSKGVEYVYPMLGKTLLIKLLVGNSYIKNQKLAKLEEYITKDVTITEEDIEDYYNKLLAKQKISFKNQSAYDSAVSGSETILYTPSDRYIYVKHILLPFSEEQTAELKKIKSKYGANPDEQTAKLDVDDDFMALILAERAELARNIVVYPHVNGEDDKTNPKTVAQVTQEIKYTMENYLSSVNNGNAYGAERAFDELIYKYNTDPGIFGNEKGYSVIYKLNAGETDTYMQEFADAARAFRDDKYKIGQIYIDKELRDELGNLVPYIITDYGIHIMYYCMDPKENDQKGLNDFVTAGRYTKIHNLMKEGALNKAKSSVYDKWEVRYIGDSKEEYVATKQKIVNQYIKDINKQIYG